MDAYTDGDWSPGTAYSTSMNRLAAAFIAILLAAALLAVPAHASQLPGGITVTPAIETITFTATQTSAHFTAVLTNNTDSPVTVAISASDFTYLDQSGAIQFLTGGSGASNPHGLATAIHSSQDLVLLAPGSTQPIGVTIADVTSLAPGGHYAALVYRVAGASSGAGNLVSLKPAVSTLIFASTAGRGTQQLELSKPISSWLRGALPSQLDLVFVNAGNTQTAVHGVAQLFSPGGRLIGQGVINVNSGLILPGLKRLFPVSLTAVEGGVRWPGVYRLTVLYRHDGQASYRHYDEYFLLINQPLLVGFGVLMIAVIGLMLRRLGGARRYIVKS